MVESDYPHRDSTWPHVQGLLREMFPAGTTPEMIRRICYGNAAELFQHPVPPDDMLAASDVGLPSDHEPAAV